ncbi:MAG: hypothetical protein E7161_00820 [Firmicutes bacterium]|nr:hypothetical protein [Bacillota bacterium]
MDIAKEILKTIFVVTESVIESYDVLKRLEIEGKSESDEYKAKLLALKSSLFLEDNFYSKLGNDIKILYRLLEAITMPSLAWDIDMDLLMAKDNHHSDLVNRRVILRLINKLNQSDKKNPFTEIVIFSSNQSNSTAVKFTKLSVAIKNDIINTILMLLNIQIENEQNPQVKSKLIEFKYNISFLYHEIEMDFVEHNFRINPQLFWVSPAVADANEIDRHFVGCYQKYYVNSITRPINELLSINKSNLSNADKFYEAVIYQIIIRVKLLFGQKEAEKSIAQTLLHNKDKKDTAIYLIKDAYEMRISDKELPNIVSLKLY